MTFVRMQAWTETQTASSKIWTRIADSISYDDNRYAKNSTMKMFIASCKIGNSNENCDFNSIEMSTDVRTLNIVVRLG